MIDRITTFVTFTMSAQSKDKFKEEWLKDQSFMSKQPGQEGGALYFRPLDDGRVQFINAAHWRDQTALNAAREAVIVMRQEEGREQESLFDQLGVSWNAKEYVVEVPYGEKSFTGT